MLDVFEPGALNYFNFFRLILSTLSVSRKPVLTPLPLSGFLDSLLCVLIAPTPDLAFSLVMPRTLVAASSFSSRRPYFLLNFLPPLLLRLIPTLIIQGPTCLLTTPSRSLFLMCTLPISAFSNGWQDRLLFSLDSSLLQKFLHSGRLQLRSPPLEPKRSFRPRGEEAFDWVISSELVPLNEPDTPTLLHRSSGSRSSPDISFAPSFLPFLAPGRCFRTWVLTTYQFFYLFLSPLSFALTSVPLPSTFRKIAGMTLLPTLTPTVLLQQNTCLFLFPLLLLSLLLWH